MEIDAIKKLEFAKRFIDKAMLEMQKGNKEQAKIYFSLASSSILEIERSL